MSTNLEERVRELENKNSLSVGATTMLRNLSIRDAFVAVMFLAGAIIGFVHLNDSIQADQAAIRATHTADHSMMLDVVKRIETADSEAFSRIETSITKLSDRVDKLYNMEKSKNDEIPFASKSQAVHFRGMKE